MAHDPEFERKHPRDPRDGQFVDNPGSAWAARISDFIGAVRPQSHSVRVRQSALPGGGYAATCDDCGASVNAPTAGEAQAAIDRIHARPQAVNPPKVESVTELKQLPQVSPDGRPISLKQLAQFGRIQNDDEQPSFDGLEFWDEHNGQWRDGGLAFMETGDDGKPELLIDDPEESLGEVTVKGGVTVRQFLDHTVEVWPNTDSPDPNLEYLHVDSGVWIDGGAIERIKSEYHDGYDWEAYDSTFEPPIAGRPAIYPTNFDSRPLDPDHKAARLVRALDLLDKGNGGYFHGGYEVLGPDGTWHLVEEAYQDDPDQEVMELIADGLHLPALDTSEELTIRRVAWGK